MLKGIVSACAEQAETNFHSGGKVKQFREGRQLGTGLPN
jgi:hypothetical protein